ncbi:MAG: DUF427 domain-containing protein [Polyangiaceae bacterium]|nr:DUF427 domain-containing protein [Polyangiaceae bacterium]
MVGEHAVLLSGGEIQKDGSIARWPFEGAEPGLYELDLAGWTRALLPVLDKVVNSAEGDVDRAFWQSFYKLQSASGGPYVTGWINVLFPYLEIMDVHQNRRAPMPNPAMARWIEGMRKDHGGPATHAATGAVRPSIGWAIGEARDLHAERARREEEEREKRLRAERDCVRIQPAGKRLRIVLGGQTIVDTGRVLAVLEEGRPPRYYVPREDVQASLAEGPGGGMCPWKGTWRSLDVTAGGETVAGGAWSYVNPTPRCQELRGHVAFFPEKMGAFTLD